MPGDPREIATGAALPSQPSDGDADADADPSTLPAPAPSSSLSGPATGGILLSRDDDDTMDEDEDVDLPLSRLAPSSSSFPLEAAATAASSLGAPTGTTAAGGAPETASSAQGDASRLISRIVTPSPFPQHTAQSRFRKALQRVAQNPTRDAEAWQVVVAEAQDCYRSLLLPSDLHDTADPALPAKLDWVESCYGALLAHFPYATSALAAVGELLFAQSARPGEEHGPPLNTAAASPQTYGYYGHQPTTAIAPPSPRSLLCQAKLHRLLQDSLGVLDWAGPEPPAAEDAQTQQPQPQRRTAVADAICSWCVELWLLYVRTKERESRRSNPSDAGAVRDATVKAYELAAAQAGFCHNNQLLWRRYLDYVKSWTSSSTNSSAAPSNVTDHALAQRQMVQLRSIYQRLVALPMKDLDAFWGEYESFETSHSEALAAALLAELHPKYQHARTIHLERTRVYGGSDVWNTGQRLATEPVQARTRDRTATMSSSTSSKAPDADTPAAADGDGEGDAAKLEEEYRLLKLWKVRCAYERTNPERLPNPKDLQHRVRTAFKELVCVFTRYPECWHMWSSWELEIPSVAPSSVSEGGGGSVTDLPGSRARAVLQLAQMHIPDSTLLCFAEAQLVELHTDRPSDCIEVMERMLQRSPNTLAFVLCQQMVRRYHGIAPARAVFARARRVLAHSSSSSGAALAASAASKRSSVVVSGPNGDVDGQEEDEAARAADEAAAAAAAVADRQGAPTTNGAPNLSNRWMVANRLDESETPMSALSSDVSRPDAPKSVVSSTLVPPSSGQPPITWHLYAAHATIEHRLNGAPEVAARVFELGLRKHAAFLTQPPYVTRYAQLLLERNDPVNLRSLLTRAIAASQEAASSSSSSDPSHPTSSSAVLPVLWDVYLRFESILSGSDPLGTKRLLEIEAKRRQAVLGADVEDVATGGFLSNSDVALIGAQKATVSELLVRAEGYNVSSSIVSGLSREVDLLETMGLWGSDSAPSLNPQHHRARYDPNVEVSGGASDASYHRRLKFQALASSGASAEAAALESGGGAGGVRGASSARERLQQGTAGATAAGQPTAMMLAIQQSPEWLRPLLLLLPASRLRLPIVSKPSPHVVELALNTLLQNQLPAERPADTGTNGSVRKRKVSGMGVGGGGDSSDDEDVTGAGQGYGNFFRSRQRSRMAVAKAGTASEKDAAL